WLFRSRRSQHELVCFWQIKFCSGVWQTSALLGRFLTINCDRWSCRNTAGSSVATAAATTTVAPGKSVAPIITTSREAEVTNDITPGRRARYCKRSLQHLEGKT
ncbi:unnamed protein product, partial [Scytosiphon promiscuus]